MKKKDWPLKIWQDYQSPFYRVQALLHILRIHRLTPMKATLALLLAAIAHGEELTGNRAPATTQCPTPEEARAKTSVPDGYAVRCFAHEAMVINPVVMPFDQRPSGVQPRRW